MGGLHEASDWSRTDRSGRHHGGCRRRSAERAATRNAAPGPQMPMQGGMCPMMSGMMGMMGGQAESLRMMQMHGEMLKAMGEIMMKYGKMTEGGPR